MATNIVASRPHKHHPTGTPNAFANFVGTTLQFNYFEVERDLSFSLFFLDFFSVTLILFYFLYQVCSSNQVLKYFFCDTLTFPWTNTRNFKLSKENIRIDLFHVYPLFQP